MIKCPPDSYKTFQSLSGLLTELILKPVTVNQPPFLVSFAPRMVAPKLQKGGIIGEAFGNSIQINNVRYDIDPIIFLSKPLHKGFTLPSQQSQQLDMVAELLIFARNLENICALSLPIYRTQNTLSYAAYINQLWDVDSPVANLQTLFVANEGDTKQVCLNYTYCQRIGGSGSTDGQNVNVYVFPRGIEIPSSNWQKIMNICENLTDFGILTGTILSTSIDFKNRFLYYSRGVSLIGRFDAGTCPAYKTKQYKCIPFDKIRNLDGDTVVFRGANTLADRLRDQEKAKKNAKKQVEGEGKNASAGIIAATVAGIFIGGLAVIFVGSKMSEFINGELKL